MWPVLGGSLWGLRAPESVARRGEAGGEQGGAQSSRPHWPHKGVQVLDSVPGELTEGKERSDAFLQCYRGPCETVAGGQLGLP